MKVLLLTSSSSLMDGINRHILSLATGLHAEGVDVSVCTTEKRGDLNEALDKNCVRTYSLNVNNGHKFAIFPRLRRVLLEFRPDVIHIHVCSLFVKVYLCFCWKYSGVITTVHGIIKKPSLVTRMLNGMLSSSYVFVSQGVANHCTWLSGDVIYNSIVTSGNSIPSGRLHNLLGLSRECKIIGTVCRIAKIKNPDAFVKIMTLVLKANQSCHAVVIGDGEEYSMQDLLNMPQQSGVVNRFHLLGYRSDARELIPDFDCFIMTSKSEGMPTSALEAISSGVPLALWRGLGGLKDLEELNRLKEYAVIGNQGDIDYMVREVLRLISDTKEHDRLSDNARNVFLENFTLENLLSKIIDKYNGVSARLTKRVS